jgi:hypothetical protein
MNKGQNHRAWEASISTVQPPAGREDPFRLLRHTKFKLSVDGLSRGVALCWHTGESEPPRGAGSVFDASPPSYEGHHAAGSFTNPRAPLPPQRRPGCCNFISITKRYLLL